MPETNLRPDIQTVNVKITEITEGELYQPTGIYDGAEQLTVRQVLSLLETATGGGRIYLNGNLSPEAASRNRQVTQGLLPRADFTYAVMAKRPQLPPVSWRAEDHILHR